MSDFLADQYAGSANLTPFRRGDQVFPTTAGDPTPGFALESGKLYTVRFINGPLVGLVEKPDATYHYTRFIGC